MNQKQQRRAAKQEIETLKRLATEAQRAEDTMQARGFRHAAELLSARLAGKTFNHYVEG